MHIPDGYLSPATCAVFYAGMVPVWVLASRKVEKALKLKHLPLLSFGAAFTFVIMMFNIPIPGGSSGHMVGSSIVAIALGPWAGVVAISLAVTLQAFFFGDGGLTTLAANCFNMAFLMSFSGYYIYRVIAAGHAGRVRTAISSAVAAYAALNIAALAVAIELGVQPAIAHDLAGRPLYAPYPLIVTVPAMLLPHLLFFGPVEALGTALAVSYVYRTNEGILKDTAEKGGLKPLWILLGIMVILTPIGLYASGTPFGEWSKEELLKLFGFVPSGMESLNASWRGVIPAYGAGGGFGISPGSRVGTALLYIVSAVAGSLGVIAVVFLWGKLWRRR